MTYLPAFAHLFGVRPFEWERLSIADVWRLKAEVDMLESGE